MGLSRNKVAVSEGAAGSPPFYGEREDMEISSYKRLYREIRFNENVVVQFTRISEKRHGGADTDESKIRAHSSAG